MNGSFVDGAGEAPTGPAATRYRTRAAERRPRAREHPVAVGERRYDKVFAMLDLRRA
ncbi:hypothetical protein ABZW30_35975 [Kitasatospora sp. NPDC004669]|uniref:hypothetical protein n=1 Tax=Kitasatospora sp. NPDC004669 TaxID=3154555 RepID=UPI0033A68831